MVDVPMPEPAILAWHKAENARVDADRYINCYEDGPVERADLARKTTAAEQARLAMVEALRAYAAQVEAAAIKPWSDAINDELLHQGSCIKDNETPREALKRAIDWSVQVSLDPLVSSDAQELIERGAAAAIEPLRRIEALAVEAPGLSDAGLGRSMALIAETAAAAIRALGQTREQGNG